MIFERLFKCQSSLRTDVDAGGAVGTLVVVYLDFAVFHFERFARTGFDTIAAAVAFLCSDLD